MSTQVLRRGAAYLMPCVMSVLISVPVFAETSALTLSGAVEKALENNGDLKSLRAEKGIYDAGVSRSALLPNPNLELEGRTGALTGSSNENGVTLGVSQEILLADKRAKRSKVAERDLEIYRWQMSDRERGIREEVKTAFHDVILARKRVDLANQAIALNRQLLDVTNERLSTGDIPELEMNLAKVELARSEGARVDVNKALLQSQARLSTLMGLQGGALPELAGDFEGNAVVMRTLPELKHLAQGRRPDLKALAAEKEKNDADIILAEAEGVPNLTVGLFYSHDRRTDATGAGEEKVRDNMVGVRLSLPIPVFDSNQTVVQEYRARRSRNDSRLQTAVTAVEREVDAAYAGYRNSEEILSLYKGNIIPQLDENLKLTQEAYRLGEMGILNVIQEQKKFFEVSDGYLLASHDRHIALVKLESAVATELSGGVE